MLLKLLLFWIERAKGMEFKRALFHIKTMFGQLIKHGRALCRRLAIKMTG